MQRDRGWRRKQAARKDGERQQQHRKRRAPRKTRLSFRSATEALQWWYEQEEHEAAR